MTPKALVITLSAVNLVIGAGLGVALDRSALRPNLPAKVADDQPTETPTPNESTDPPKDVQTPNDERRHGRRGRGRSEWLKRALDLDDEQTVKIKEIMEARRPKFDAVFEEFRPRLKTLEDETHAEIKKVLRPEQIEKFDEMRKHFKSRGRRGGRRSGRRGPGSWGEGRGPGRGDGERPGRGKRPSRGEGAPPAPDQDGGQ